MKFLSVVAMAAGLALVGSTMTASAGIFDKYTTGSFGKDSYSKPKPGHGGSDCDPGDPGTPSVPVPAAGLLMVGALGGLGALRARRKSN